MSKHKKVVEKYNNLNESERGFLSVIRKFDFTGFSRQYSFVVLHTLSDKHY